MVVALAALTYGFWGWDEEDDSFGLSQFRQQLVLLSMFVYIAGYQVGYGPITWTLLSEIFPTEIRGTAMALSVEVNFLAKFLCQLTFPMVQDILGWGCTFIAFIIIVSISFLFIFMKVPETKGLSLEEIQVQLQSAQRSSMRFEMGNNSSKAKPLASPLLERTQGASQYPASNQHGLTPIV